ncbi:MAG TPA: long-chain fatty acid--CoA ligase [Gemmatimonadales bacterium]|nr:long-chain fatty acid--CoA ligase [Gemmatimonadales bacterium]
MQGLMMDWQLTLTHVLERARRVFHEQRISSRHAAGVHRYRFADMTRRADRLAGALAGLGVARGDRIGTLGWNSHRHLEAYYAVPCMGAVLHTLNLRLHPDQLAYVINHARDRVLLVDASLLPLLEKVRDRIPTVEQVVVMSDGPLGAGLPPGAHDYEALLAAASGHFLWPELDEQDAAALCYTSGTTGHPKGVLYSHRSLVLHTLGFSIADAFAIRERDVVLTIVPMFHANAWGLPFAAGMLGCSLVLPGPHLVPKDLVDLIESEGVTFVGGVPTIVSALYQYLKESGRKVPTLRQILVGGSALPRVLLENFEAMGIEVVHAWGMTELSPAGTVSRLRRDMDDWPPEEKTRVRLLQGSPFPLVELRILMDDGTEAPWDGVTAGELEARGPWVARAYYEDPSGADRFHDGWFRTGDVASIDARGYVRLVDRTKDMVKSGGEWISSVDLENVIMGHPQVAEAAVIAVAHPKWTERPLACVVPKPDCAGALSRSAIREWLRGRVADWWLPDDVVVIEGVPKTSVGKFDKKVLRERFKDHVWPEAS